MSPRPVTQSRGRLVLPSPCVFKAVCCMACRGCTQSMADTCSMILRRCGPACGTSCASKALPTRSTPMQARQSQSELQVRYGQCPRNVKGARACVAPSETGSRLTSSRRAQLILVDDPNFVPDFGLPALQFDDNGGLVLPGLDFSSGGKLCSQFSPMDSGGGSPANLPFVDLNIRHSSSQASVNLASPFNKPNQPQNDNSTMGFGEEEELPWDNFPIRIDADGNLIEEPQLPVHPAQLDQDPFGQLGDPAHKVPEGPHLPDDNGLVIFGDEDVQINPDDDEQHQQQQQQFAVLGSAQYNAQDSKDVRLPSEEELSSDLGDVPPPKRRQRKIKSLAPDFATHVSRAELRSWMDGYATRIEEAQHATSLVTLAQARKNAYNLVFGAGLGDIGVFSIIPGLEHELSEFFAGDNLKEMLLGNMIDVAEEEGDEDLAEGARGGARRRSASVAFGSEGDQSQDGRRVRSRADREGGEQGAQIINDGMMGFGSDPAEMIPEVGREHPGSALSDHHRSSNAPWNRRSSVEVGRNAVEGSPLIGRGSMLQQSNVKFSDDRAPAFGSDGFAPLQYDGAHDLSSFADFGAAEGVALQEASTSQIMRKALDREGRDFLSFVEQVAAQRGEEDEQDEDLRWVEFDGLFEREDQTRAVASQAFLHVLTLATKGQVRVKQEDLKKYEPFGKIHVGITTALHDEYRSAEKEPKGEEMEGVELDVEQDVE
ncbi:unnamed protein product [Discula destructiva]